MLVQTSLSLFDVGIVGHKKVRNKLHSLALKHFQIMMRHKLASAPSEIILGKIEVYVPSRRTLCTFFAD